MCRALALRHYAVAVWDIRYGAEFDLSNVGARETLRGWIAEGRVRGLIVQWPFKRCQAVNAEEPGHVAGLAELWVSRARAVDRTICAVLDACWHSQTPVIVIRRYDPQLKPSRRFHSISQRCNIKQSW